MLALITFPNLEWIEELRSNYQLSSKFIDLLHKLRDTLKVPNSPFQNESLTVHTFRPIGGTFGLSKDISRGKRDFILRCIESDIKRWGERM